MNIVYNIYSNTSFFLLNSMYYIVYNIIDAAYWLEYCKQLHIEEYCKQFQIK